MDNEKDFFSRQGGFIFIFFLLNSLTTITSFLYADKVTPAIQYGCLVLIIVTAIAALIDKIPQKKWARRLKISLCVLFSIPFCIETAVMHYYYALIGTGIVNAILATNQKETVEFLKMYVAYEDIAGLAVIIAVITATVKFRPWEKFSLRISPKILKILGAACVVTALSSLFYGEFYFENLMIVRAVSSFAESVENISAYRRLAAEAPSDVQILENNAEIENIVIILGESTNRNHMHLYGYYLENTPGLEKLAAAGEAAVFTDIVSHHSTTVAVLSELFTFCDEESDKEWYEYHNLIDVMNAAGYHTHWLSNQESSGVWGNVAELYADRSTYRRFTRIRDSHEDNGILDETLLPIIDEAIAAREGRRNFYVLHLMGGHGLYYNRYPYSFHRFTSKDIRLEVSDRFKEIVAEYDNALYYNDFVVNEIISRFRGDEAIAIYVPDHGEAVYDEGGSIAGHIEENANRHMIEIPLIIWASEKFRAKYPKTWQRIAEATDRPYMTDDMIHTVLDVAGIKTPEYDPAKSLINDEFDSSRPRIIFGEEDYDKTIRPR